MNATTTLSEPSTSETKRLSEADLLARVRGGDERAFRELVERYEPVVAATVHGMLGAGAEAEDVGQEVFIRFYRSLDRFRGDASLKTYLTRIAINLSLNALKKRQRFLRRFRDNAPLERLPAPRSGPGLELQDRAAFVHRAIQQLDAPFRSVVVLRLIDGYTTQETADLLGIPLGTALSRLARAQKKLKSMLSPYLNDDET